MCKSFCKGGYPTVNLMAFSKMCCKNNLGIDHKITQKEKQNSKTTKVIKIFQIN